MRAKRLFAGIATAIAVLQLASCAAQPQSGGDKRQASMQCPPGATLTCEVDRTGRLYHGTFKKDLDKCGCVDETSRTINSPAIPSIH